MSESIIKRVKDAAIGRCNELSGLASELLDGREHDCPRCGQRKFNVKKDFNDSGNAYCRSCCPKGTGDIINFRVWLSGGVIGQVDSAKKLSQELGIETRSNQAAKRLDAIDRVCQAKSIARESLLRYGARTQTRRGTDGQSREVVRVPMHGEDGEIVSWFTVPESGKGLCDKGKPSGLFLPGRKPTRGERWILVEGVKDAAALASMGYLACGMPGCELGDSFAPLFAGCFVTVVPDKDRAGLAGATRTASRLIDFTAETPKIAKLPGESRRKKGDDIRDLLKRQGGEAKARKAIDTAGFWDGNILRVEGSEHRRIEIELEPEADETTIVSAVVDALGTLDGDDALFVSGESLVQPFPPLIATGTWKTRAVSKPIVRNLITRACRLFSREGKGRKHIAPPGWLVDSVYSLGNYGGKIRTITGIIEAPTIRPDGSILQSSGWDAPTGLVLKSSIDFPEIANEPTKADARQAAETLLEVVVDFPFRNLSDRSAWLALVLSLVGRAAVDGCVPLFPIAANVRGSGKSKLADAASLIAYGRPAARKPFAKHDDEQRKVITTIALEGGPVVLFDNLDGRLSGASLDAALTASTWSDRLLGVSATTGELPLRTVWIATGNNLSFGSAIARRVLPITLMSELENPEDRKGFKHPDLLGWIANERPRLVSAALTILRAWFKAGKPQVDRETWGSFEEWTRVIRGSIVWLGLADPLQTREIAKESDDSAMLLGLLIAGIEEADPDGRGLTAAEIAKKLSRDAGEWSDCPSLTEASAMICGQKFDTRRFGNRVKEFQNRVHCGKRIVATSAIGGVKRYRVESIESGSSGSSGSCISYARKELNLPLHQQDSPKETWEDRNPLNQLDPLCEPNGIVF